MGLLHNQNIKNQSTKKLLETTNIASPETKPASVPGKVVVIYGGVYQEIITVGPLTGLPYGDQWGQGCVYNQYCPVNAGGDCGHDKAGCIPLAMGMIMSFWQSPAGYNWAQMKPTNANSSVAGLLTDIGSTNDGSITNGEFASYGPSQTVANDLYAPNVFANFGSTNVSRSETISDQITTGEKDGTAYGQLLLNEVLVNERPCMLGGYASENDILGVMWPQGEGHESMCEGVQEVDNLETETTVTYAVSPPTQVLSQVTATVETSYSDFLFMNWGQAGTGNAFYDCSTDYTSYPGADNYQFFQTVIYNIYPN